MANSDVQRPVSAGLSPAARRLLEHRLRSAAAAQVGIPWLDPRPAEGQLARDAAHGLPVDRWPTHTTGAVRRRVPVHDRATRAIDYLDHAAWQRNHADSTEAKGDLEHWRIGLTPLELPTDHPRSPEHTHVGAVYEVTPRLVPEHEPDLQHDHRRGSGCA